jgi:hypothetical protein
MKQTVKEIMRKIMTGLAIMLAMDLVCGLAISGKATAANVSDEPAYQDYRN